MLHLLQRAVSPAISLKESVQDWFAISRLLREPPRKRGIKIEEMESPKAALS